MHWHLTCARDPWQESACVLPTPNPYVSCGSEGYRHLPVARLGAGLILIPLTNDNWKTFLMMLRNMGQIWISMESKAIMGASSQNHTPLKEGEAGLSSDSGEVVIWPV